MVLNIFSFEYNWDLVKQTKITVLHSAFLRIRMLWPALAHSICMCFPMASLKILLTPGCPPVHILLSLSLSR